MKQEIPKEINFRKIRRVISVILKNTSAWYSKKKEYFRQRMPQRPLKYTRIWSGSEKIWISLMSVLVLNTQCI